MSNKGPDFTSATEDTIIAAVDLAKQNANSVVAPLHLAVALLQDSTTKTGGAGAPTLLSNLVTKAGGDPQALARNLQRLMVRLPVQNPAPEQPDMSKHTQDVLFQARTIQKERSDSYISQDALILALVQKDTAVARAFKEAGVSEAQLKNAISDVRGSKRVESKQAEQGYDALEKYAVDLTQLAEEGKLDPVIGRDNEIRRVIRVLSRRTKNNPVLIGEPGVGKSAIAEGLAQRIVNRDVPANLLGRLYSLDMGALLAGASYKGEYEQRVKDVLAEVEKAENAGQILILFIDEMHLIMAGKGDSGMQASELFKPMLARGKLRTIGATTLNEYRQYIEKDAAFERRFQQVLVNEPSVNETISILRGIREKYEVHHAVNILDSSIVAAANLAHRYLTSRKLPDAAIDLVDEAAAAVRVSRDSQPEAIDQAERSKLQLEVEIRALEKEKDDASKDRLKKAKQEMRDIDDRLAPLRADYEATKQSSENIQVIRQKIDDLRAKAERAERNYDLATAADLRHYAIPENQKRLEQLEAQKSHDDTARGMDLDTVTPDAIAEIVARWTGIPTTRLQATEKEKLLQMEHLLSSEIVGQPDACKSVANAIRLSRSGLASQDKPIASLLFCGPSGVGKTELTKCVARFLFDSEKSFMRIDASEYSEKHAISRLIGSPPGYVGHESGGQLTEFVRRHPYSVILIDEVEKASREFTTLFLQVMDAGRLSDSQGRVVNFKNTVIVMTSNLGAQYINEAPEGPLKKQTKELIHRSIRSHFLPEFLGRLDAIVLFNKLGGKQVRDIVEIRLKELQKRMDDNGRKITLDVDDAAKDWLGAAGVSPLYGARPLSGVLQNHVLIPLSRFIIEESIRDGEVARVSFDRRRNRVVVLRNHESTQGGYDDSMDLDDDLNDPEMQDLD